VISPSQRPLPAQDNTTYKHKRQTSMPSAVFEPAIPATKSSQTYALDRAATGARNLPTQDNTTHKDEDKYPCLKRDSNPRSQCARDQGIGLRTHCHWEQHQLVIDLSVFSTKFCLNFSSIPMSACVSHLPRFDICRRAPILQTLYFIVTMV
jgi:hypothetical protein